ncbi:hypothetical protein PUNSTDRAFT_87654 [Punctularia strigosozonata HHB-11173 SS5]|uniref:uncharacterized protein n=1 Tax=Punctularia strigosozonata (strain HHB-11173) TaxID=741275 RepID=UPI0004418538|nr:uncharacterized protein PUNSTDRAFT_87654 [Punctularia strigosozonata HHB-11173 SS5]EIN08296.1 hypothetical protein PUNSTDRAFT_87654 [Punctularia strigosozonata HHB-11173 SS5]
MESSGPTSLALLHYSLAGGFSSPRITRVLELTSYLIPRMSESTGCPLSSSAESRERSDKATYERLLETAQWVLDCMDGLEAILPPTGPGDPGGRGWEATVQVRLLHAQMRAQVLGRAKVYATKGDNDTAYSVTVDGVPLNQEDMAATLGAFSVAPIWSLERMGFHLSAREKEAYLFLWRYLGYYLGIRNLILDRHFSSWARAEAFLLSSVLHLFAFRKTPEQLARLPTIPVLRAVSGRPPFRSSLRYNLAISRSLLGDEFASDLGIPSTTFYSWMQVQLSFVTMRVPVLFGQFYPRKRWEWKRREVIRRALPRVVIWGLGGRRTNFVVGKDKWCTVDMKSDRWVRDGQEIMRMWKEIWRELSLVVAGCICVGTIVGYGVWASLS